MSAVAKLPVNLDTMIAEIERELEMRAQVYPGMVFNRKLRQIQADFQIANMQMVVDVLRAVKAWTKAAAGDVETEGPALIGLAIAAIGRAKERD